ncbi:unnamed protein product [Ceratitis capitata]|uniref:(Mediterranean fruit fly) hypothetical protein n=1 Tax=Ceratitis capitata TaxID=7213 RepID=A0A811UK62_CERCA|nr:unnamed protein product [Ceratitis capitata]
MRDKYGLEWRRGSWREEKIPFRVTFRDFEKLTGACTLIFHSAGRDLVQWTQENRIQIYVCACIYTCVCPYVCARALDNFPFILNATLCGQLLNGIVCDGRHSASKSPSQQPRPSVGPCENCHTSVRPPTTTTRTLRLRKTHCNSNNNSIAPASSMLCWTR